MRRIYRIYGESAAPPLAEEWELLKGWWLLQAMSDNGMLDAAELQNDPTWWFELRWWWDGRLQISKIQIWKLTMAADWKTSWRLVDHHT